MSILKMAYIGFGKSAKRYHLPFVMQLPNIEVTLAFDRMGNNAENKMQYPHISFVDSIEDILQHSDIELVAICTPPQTHYDIAKACVLAGKHALVEKPFCVTYEEAKELFELAKSNKVHLMAYQNRRFDGDFELLQEIITSKKLGVVKEIQSSFDYYRPVADSGVRISVREQGSFYGMGVHLIDQIIALLGVPNKVVYDISTQRENSTLDDAFHIQLIYPNNLKAILSLTHLKNYPTPRFLAYGTEATFVKYGQDKQEFFLKKGLLPSSDSFGEDIVEHYGQLIQTTGEVTKTTTWLTPIGDYGKIYQAMYETIREGKPKIISDEQTLIVIKILDDCTKNTNTNVLFFNR